VELKNPIPANLAPPRICIGLESFFMTIAETTRMSAPLYLQIANSLAERIRQGELRVGDWLPSERELARDLAVSRLTVRQALSTLRQQGLIDPQHGKGYFVRQPRIEQPADVLIGFSDNMLAKGIRPGARILSLETRLADRALAPELEISVGDPLFVIHRLRLANEAPVALEYSYFPARLFPQLDTFDLETRSIYAILSEEYGVNLVAAAQSLEPVVAQPAQAKLLEIRRGAPLMLVMRTSRDEQRRVVEYARDLYRGD
jgi:GntR family transcriptional regulator